MSAYHSNFVAVVLDAAGHPLREESKDGRRTVRMEFGTEYRLRLKNKTASRALAEVWIDGTLATAARLILAPGETIDLERFILPGQYSSGNRFKFISVEQGAQTGELQDPTSRQNGEISVKFFPEKILGQKLNSRRKLAAGGQSLGGRLSPQGILRGASSTFTTYQTGVPFDLGMDLNSVGSCVTNSKSDVGGTAMGSDSAQAFYQSSESFPLEAPVTLTIWLKGPEQQQGWVVQMLHGEPCVSVDGIQLGSLQSVEFTPEGLRLTIPKGHYQIRS